MKKVVAFIILCSIFVTGCSIKKVKELSDAEKFANEFNISKKNPFVYAKYKDIENIFQAEGIIFFANSDDEKSLKAAEILNEVLKDVQVEKIYYYNPKKKEKEITKYLKKENKEYQLSLPLLISIKEKKIVGYSNDLSNEKELSEEKLTKKKRNQIKKKYKKIISSKEYRNNN